MKYLIIDGMLNGTGIRDKYNGGYIEPEKLLLSDKLLTKLKKWKKEYEKAKFCGYTNKELVSKLDNKGVNIAKDIKKELGDVKIEYYSDAQMKKIIIN